MLLNLSKFTKINFHLRKTKSYMEEMIRKILINKNNKKTKRKKMITITKITLA